MKRDRGEDGAITPGELTDAYNDPAQRQPADMAAFLVPLWRLNDGHLFRAASHIPNSGLGLFTRDAIARGTAITWYSGAVVTYAVAAAMKRADPTVKAYEHDLMGMRFLILGDYHYTAAAPAQPERVPYADLDRVFTGHGASQFTNSVSPSRGGDAAVAQNVAHISVKDARWNIAAGEDVLAATDRLVARYPHAEGRAVITFALDDIAAGDELVANYGAGYFGGGGGNANKVPRFRACAACGTVALWQCSKCKSVAYCTTECQTLDWHAHAMTCHVLH